MRNLGNNSISWLRHSNINLLSVGKFKYSQDPRYQILHNNDTWTLKVHILSLDKLQSLETHPKQSFSFSKRKLDKNRMKNEFEIGIFSSRKPD